MRHLLVAAVFAVFAGMTAAGGQLTGDFDPIGPTVQTLETASGRTVAYVDDGNAGDTPVVFFGGSGTSVRVMNLLEFANTLRGEVGLRLISVERNGFGQTAFDPSLDYTDYAQDVEAVLDELGVDRFIAFGISGGSPYLTEFVSRNADRVISVHLASALSEVPPGSFICALPGDPDTVAFLAQNPMVWFAFSPDSPVQQVPGLQDEAFDDSARTFFIAGQMASPDPLIHEFELYCNSPLGDVSGVTAPVHLYYGADDTTTPPDFHIPVWQSIFPNVANVRTYPGLGHDAQYRHWDQIMVDMSTQRTDRILVCDKGKTSIVSDDKAVKILDKGGTLGMCGWAQ
jgi:pimeloyl-ACP methyl ester carboxylesterase